MVRIGNVWDDASDVLVGRAGVLLPIAAVAFFLPTAIGAANRAYLPDSVGKAVVAMLIAIAALLVQLWGQLAIVAVASDPATTRADAGAAGIRRLGPALLVTLVLLAGTVIALLPIGAVVAATRFDWHAAATSGNAVPTEMPAGARAFCTLYGLLLLAGLSWLGARLFVLMPIVLNERRGIGAFGRSFQLTRGLALRLIGVTILFGIVLLVASWAAKAVVFVVLRLVLGGGAAATATFLSELAVAAVQAALVTVAIVFAARLYAALVGGKSVGGASTAS